MPHPLQDCLSLVRNFGVDSNKPVLIRAQCRALARQIPLLYVILAVNTALLDCAFLERAPQLITVWIPLGFGAACTHRGLTWWRLRHSDFDNEQIAAGRVRRAVCLCFVAGLLCSCWALWLTKFGDDLARAHVAFYLAVTVASSIFCLMNIPAAAVASTAAILVPFGFEFSRHNGHVTLIILDSLFVFAALLAVMKAEYLNFLRLITTHEQLTLGQAEQKRLADANLLLAELDHLTQLPNRRRFFSDLEQAMSTSSGGLTVALVDLDGFKPVNDIFGHAAGDEVLVQAAKRLTEQANGAHVARLGGDEFAVILPATMGEEAVVEWGRRTCAALSDPYPVEGAVAHVSGTIGLSGLQVAGVSARQLVERADYALYAAKQSRAGCPLFYTRDHDGEVRRAALIAQGLRSESLEDELHIVYQPIIDTHKETIISVEALARWSSPDLGSIPPDEFVSVAENTGAINRLTPILLKKALRDAKRWPDSVRLSFNLSAHDLMAQDALAALLSVVSSSGVSPGRLDFEVTETVLMSDLTRAKAAVERLRHEGFGVSLDDFGTGHSSLSRVHQLALDKIKIDRSFVSNLETSPAASGVTKTVIDMCRNLGLVCIVEGVETHDQELRLRQFGARYMQGYLFARPQSGKEIAHSIAQALTIEDYRKSARR